MILLASWTASMRLSGEKQRPSPPTCAASCQVPTTHKRQGAAPVNSHRPSALNRTVPPSSIGSLNTSFPSDVRQRRTAPIALALVATHSPSGLTATPRTSSSGPTVKRPSRRQDMDLPNEFATAMICALPVLGNVAMACRQRKPSRRADLHNSPRPGVRLNRPAPDAEMRRM